MRILFLHGPDDIEEFLFLFLTAMGKVETKDVGTGQEQFFNHFQIGRRGSQRHDLFRRFTPSLGHLGHGGDGGLLRFRRCRRTVFFAIGRRKRG